MGDHTRIHMNTLSANSTLSPTYLQGESKHIQLKNKSRGSATGEFIWAANYNYTGINKPILPSSENTAVDLLQIHTHTHVCMYVHTHRLFLYMMSSVCAPSCVEKVECTGEKILCTCVCMGHVSGLVWQDMRAKWEYLWGNSSWSQGTLLCNSLLY